MIVRTPSGDVTSVDYREKAPLTSTRTMYLKPDGTIDRSLTEAGYLAPGVPGTLRGLELAHKKFGKLPWKDVVTPSVQLAEGFTLSAALAKSLNSEVQKGMSPFPASVEAYGKPGGGEWAAGDTLVLRDLGTDVTGDRRRGAGCFLQGVDRRSHCRSHADQRRTHLERGSRGLPGERAQAAERHLQGLRDHLDAPAQLGRRRAHRDAEHPGKGGSQIERAADGACPARPDRGHAAGVSRSRPLSG